MKVFRKAGAEGSPGEFSRPGVCVRILIPKTLTPLYPVTEPSLTPKNIEAGSDMASISVNDMKNPIEPVTARLSETLNKPIDFRTAKASKQKGGGFYLKIGKLEISHQTASL